MAEQSSYAEESLFFQYIGPLYLDHWLIRRVLTMRIHRRLWEAGEQTADDPGIFAIEEFHGLLGAAEELRP